MNCPRILKHLRNIFCLWEIYLLISVASHHAVRCLFSQKHTKNKKYIKLQYDFIIYIKQNVFLILQVSQSFELNIVKVSDIRMKIMQRMFIAFPQIDAFSAQSKHDIINASIHGMIFVNVMSICLTLWL